MTLAAAGQGVVNGGDQLVHRDAPVAVGIETRTSVAGLLLEGQRDAEDDLVDPDRVVTVAVARTEDCFGVTPKARDLRAKGATSSMTCGPGDASPGTVKPVR